ncbi:MAG: ABC transporter permease [Actinomycetales bacterium]|nr:ABC transporter permease [Actinomycetales bacterium]
MTAALHYEWVRISTVRSTRILLVVLLVVSAGLGWLVAVPHYLAYDETGNPIGPAVVNWWKAFGMPLSLTAVLTSVVAAQAIGQEYRFGLIRLTLTAFPLRRQILAAKLIVVAGACVVFTLVSYLGSLLALTIRGYPTPPAAAPEAQDLYLLKGVVLVLLWGLSSFALAGIVRQTAVGIVVPVVSGALLETLLIALLSDRAPWLDHVLPWSTAARWAESSGGDGPPTGWAALGVLAVWVVGLLVVQVVAFLRRDA